MFRQNFQLKHNQTAPLVATLLLDLAPLGNVAVVLGEGFGEGVAAAAVGEEIEVGGRGRVEHGLERGAPRVGDRGPGGGISTEGER